MSRRRRRNEMMRIEKKRQEVAKHFSIFPGAFNMKFEILRTKLLSYPFN
jgi:hypothetical protein